MAADFSKTGHAKRGKSPKSLTRSKITPLRDAHMTLNDEMNHVMNMGSSILTNAGLDVTRKLVYSTIPLNEYGIGADNSCFLVGPDMK